MKPAITSFSGQYSFLSNFYLQRILYDGNWFPSVEHAFQSMKMLPAERVNSNINFRAFQSPSVTPGQAKRLGRKVTMRADWDEIRQIVMETLVSKKFDYMDLRALLIETSPAELIEGNTWNDTFWGVCNGVGENHLGKILMKRRDEIILSHVFR